MNTKNLDHHDHDAELGRVEIDGEVFYGYYGQEREFRGSTEASVDGDGGTIRGKPVFDIDMVAFYLNRGIGTTPGEFDGANSGAEWFGAQGDTNNTYYGPAISKTDFDGTLNTMSFGFYETLAEVPDVYAYGPEMAGTTAFLNQKAGFSAFSDAQKEAARQAIESWDELIAVDFIETTSGQADMAMMNTSTGPIQASAYLPYDYGAPAVYDGTDPAYAGHVYDFSIISGDVYINPAQSSNQQFDEGQYGLTTLIHEIGHGLGLEHPGSYNFGPGFDVIYDNGAEYYQDSNQYSIMSYWDAEETGADRVDWALLNYNYSSTPSVHDIAAIQRIYGADLTTRNGDDTYGFNTSLSTTGSGDDSFDFGATPLPVVTIWDGGGHDTLDLSGYKTDSIIDIGEGQFSSAGGFFSETIPTLEEINARRVDAGLAPTSQGRYDLYIELFGAHYNNGLLTDNISIAYGVTIEDAVGGGGNDTITGNEADNVLSGRAGDDVIDGGLGNDRVLGNGHTDTLSGGEGNDTLFGGAGDDSLAGGTGLDRLVGSTGADTFIFAENDQVDRLLGFESGVDKIDLTAFEGIDSGDVKMVGKILFVNTDDVQGYDLRVVSNAGDAVAMSDILFAPVEVI